MAKMTVRSASISDIDEIINLLLRGQRETARNTIRSNPEKMRQYLHVFIGAPNMFTKVLDIDGKIAGILIGAVIAPWHSEELQASDLEFYVAPEARGHGVSLDRAFSAWARERGAVEMQRCITSGAEEAGKYYERLGYSSVGNVWVKRVEP